MSNIDNPFIIYGYVSPEYFCDRKEETKEVISALTNGCNMTIMSPRRYGKTGLIKNVFFNIKHEIEDVECFYIDIYATNSLSDFVQALGKTVIGKLDTPIQKAEGYISRIIKSAQITMSPDLATGLPQFSLNFQPQFATNTLEEIFNYIRQSDRKCYIAIDEFQQVLEYPEKNIEALLRTQIQQTTNARFIFCGSKLHMMTEMFNSPKHPFYRSTEKLHLDVLDKDTYYNFIIEKLKEKNISLPRSVFDKLYNRMDGVTWYIQTIMNRLYRLGECTIDEETVNKAIYRIIKSEEDDYKRLYHILTANQSSLLKAIAKEGIVKEPLAGLFIRTHNLKSTSSVQRALAFLLQEEYIYKAETGYIIYDRLFGLWLKYQ